jgi:hypothetical protein
MNFIIGADFSIAKPAFCVYDGKNYYFYSYVKNLSDKLIKIYLDSGIYINKRIHKDIKDIVRNDLINSNILSDLIIKDLNPYIKNDSIFVFEGTSFASKGNQTISLTAWRYIFMQRLYNENIPFEHMTTYAPISIKKTAGCSEKGKTKKDMIDAFVQTSSCELAKYISSNPSLFKKKTGTWIEHLDDLVDSYWAVETYLLKN